MTGQSHLATWSATGVELGMDADDLASLHSERG